MLNFKGNKNDDGNIIEEIYYWLLILMMSMFM